MTRSRIGSLLAIAVLLAGACSDDPSEPEAGSTPTTTETTGGSATSPTTEPDSAATTAAEEEAGPVLLGEWQTDSLPTPISALNSCGDTVTYEAFDDGQLTLVSFDAASGALRYEIDIDRGSILSGQSGYVQLDCDAELVFGLEASGAVGAHDIAGGDQLWRTVQPVDRFLLCGAFLCAQDSDANRETIFEHGTGGVVSIAVQSDGRVLAQDEGFRLFPARDSITKGPEELVGFELHERLWSIDADEIRTAAGHDFTPSTGWHSPESEVPGVNVQYLGPAFDQSAAPADRVSGGGVLFAYEQATGAIEWVRGDMVACGDRIDVYCVFDGYTDGNFDIFEIVRIDLTNGENLWSHPVDRYSVIARSVDHLRLDQFRDREVSFQEWLDLETGAVIAEPDQPFEVCSNYDDFDDSEEARLRVYSEAADEEMEWFLEELPFPCDEAGDPISNVEVLASDPAGLQDLAHTTENNWHIFHDGQQMQALRLEVPEAL